MRKTDIKILIASMRILSRDIQSQDGVANAAIGEAAQRLEEQHDQLANQAVLIRKLNEDISTLQSVVDAGTARVEAAEKQLMSLWDTGCDIQSEHGEVRLHVKGTSPEEGERQALVVRGLTDYIKDMESKLAWSRSLSSKHECTVEKLTKEVATLKAAVRKAAETFEFYSALHSDKGTPEGAGKAMRNASLAKEMWRAFGDDQNPEQLKAGKA